MSDPLKAAREVLKALEDLVSDPPVDQRNIIAKMPSGQRVRLRASKPCKKGQKVRVRYDGESHIGVVIDYWRQG